MRKLTLLLALLLPCGLSAQEAYVGMLAGPKRRGSELVFGLGYRIHRGGEG